MKLKRIAGIVLFITLSLVLNILAFASYVSLSGQVKNHKLGNGDGSLSVEFSTAGYRDVWWGGHSGYKLNRNSITVYRIFDAEVRSDGTAVFKLPEGVTAPPEAGKLSKFDVDASGRIGYYTREKEEDTWTLNTAGGEMTEELIGKVKAYIEANKDKLVSDTCDSLVDDYYSTRYQGRKITYMTVPYGYYFISESLGSIVAIDANHPDATIKEKNTAPQLDKKITQAGSIDEAGKNALAEIGSTVRYESTITVGAGPLNYTFHDAMDNGLKSDRNAEVFLRTIEGDTITDTPVDTGAYTVRYYIDEIESTPSNEIAGVTDDTQPYNNFYGKYKCDCMEIVFQNAYTQTLEPGTKLVVKYSAKVLANAMALPNSRPYDPNPSATQDTAGLLNSAWLTFGHESAVDMTPWSRTRVYNAAIAVLKTEEGFETPVSMHDFNKSEYRQKLDENGNPIIGEDGRPVMELVPLIDRSKILAGAKFVLQNEDGKYYKFNGELRRQDGSGAYTGPGGTAAEYDDSVSVNWVDKIEDADELVTVEEEMVFFYGLSSGKYKLIETAPPKGYNVAEPAEIVIEEIGQIYQFMLSGARGVPDPKNPGRFIITDAFIRIAHVIDKKSALLPSTGGPGTTALTVIGTILVLAAGLLLTKKSKYGMGSR